MDVIEKIIDAGRWAPSGLNNQAWRFIVVRDNGTK
ncbi:MAG: nitroreductase family protein [Candidatus Methanoperedens sp.]|nr:nitroreductase family protein [Candidatus Methanoperedens sp.]